MMSWDIEEPGRFLLRSAGREEWLIDLVMEAGIPDPLSATVMIIRDADSGWPL